MWLHSPYNPPHVKNRPLKINEERRMHLTNYLVFGKIHQISGYPIIKNPNSVNDWHDFCSTNFVDFFVESLGTF
jgi:hypothetical protein